MSAPARQFRRSRRASIIVVVMITLLFATFALIAFMEKAANDLLIDHRAILNKRLRMEAYSALEVTLAVLERFREVNNGLRSPAEGWNDPLEFAGYTPFEGRTVRVEFEDESGKISLPRVNPQVLVNLFKNWELPDHEAEELADALMGWMSKSHVYSTAVNPDYETREIPYETPGRPLRSFQELAAIEKVREKFYDEDGRPNDLWRRFAGAMSLLNFARPNINGALPDTMAAVAMLEPTQQGYIQDYIRGSGSYAGQGPGYFRSPGDAQQVAGASLNGFGATISALRIHVTVLEGTSEYRLSAVIAPPGGATTVQTNATAQRQQASADAKQAGQAKQPNPNQAVPPPNPNASARGAQDANARNLRYPFTLLEIQENEDIPPSPPPPPPAPF